jgi:predicted DNA-binding protein
MYQMAFSLTLDLDEKLTLLSKKTGKSKSFLVREAVQFYLKNFKDCVFLDSINIQEK